MFGLKIPAPARQMTDADWQKQASFAGERDVADRLPTVARAKLVALRDELAEMRATIAVPRAKLEEARDRLRRVDLRLADLRRGGMHGEHPATVAELEVRARLADEVKSASEEYSRRSGAVAPLGGMIRRLEEYVAGLPQSGVAMAPAAKVTLGKGETPLQALGRTREQIVAAEDAAQSVRDAPIPSSVVKQRARAQIAALAERGRPDVQAAIDFSENIKWPTVPASVFIAHDARHGSADVFDAQATICWLFRDQLIARLDAEIDNAADDAGALDDQTRSKKLAAAKAARLSLEREEEALVLAIRESGVAVARRADCDPRAILGLADSAPAPTED